MMGLALSFLGGAPALAGKVAGGLFRNWRLALGVLAVLAVVVLLWRTWAWFGDNADEHVRKDAEISLQAETIVLKNQQIDRLNAEVRQAEIDLQNAKATFDNIVEGLKADLAAVSKSRANESARAQQYRRIMEELRRDYPESFGPADPVLLAATERVRLRLRPTLPAPIS